MSTVAEETEQRPRVNNGNGRLPRGTRKMTEAQRTRLLNRETMACGPAQLVTRFAAVETARRLGDPAILAGALDDLASAAVTWSTRCRADVERRAAGA